MSFSIRQILFALLLVGVSPAVALPNNFTGIVAFGDSLSDLGNTVDRFDTPLLREILYNTTGYSVTNYDNGRWSNGPVWVEDLNFRLGLPALQQNNGNGTNTTGTNYAWGGALSGAGTTDFGLVNNLQLQVSDYISILNANPTGQPAAATTLYTVWAGGNDVIGYVSNTIDITPQQVADNIATAVTSLYNAGGRTFLVPNLPPLGDKPSYDGDQVAKVKANNFVQAYNPLLTTALGTLQATLPGIQVIPLDVYALFIDVLAQPGSYGLTNTTNAAWTPDGNPPNGGTIVPNPDQYLFWDGTHPTRIGHDYIGQYAYDAVYSAVPEPATIVPLAVGALLAIAAHRRRRRA